ncbi:MAG: UPF0158 family protein [Proteobacteria bacterium]|nr:UPF0158 family protein [Pseudomonadota bacterium]
MPLPMNLQAVADQMDLPSDEMTACISRITGALVSFSDEEFFAAEPDVDDAGTDELSSEWRQEAAEQANVVLENDDYVALPNKFDIHECSIMERFCHSLDDERVRNALLRAIGGRGAFRSFKDRISEEGVREDWFAFRSLALKRIAADFLESQGIPFIDQ